MPFFSFNPSRHRQWIAGLLVGCASLTCGAQITVDQSLTFQEYVNSLLGEGVVAYNVNHTGANLQFGFFEGGASVGFPIDEGVVLSSANALSAFPDADGTCLGENVPLDSSETGDPVLNSDLLEISQSVSGLLDASLTDDEEMAIIQADLSMQTGNFAAFLDGQNQAQSVNDVCALEFDFEPAGDFVSFNYVFASEEYWAYEYQVYNDVFAFFLSGEGISGQYGPVPGFPNGAVNIAEVPGNDPQLPVTISSVNADVNAEYFLTYQDIDEDFDGIPEIQNSDINGDGDSDVCFDGATVVLTAVYPVLCGETYHIELAVGDGQDGALGTHVFIEAGSFGSPIPTTYESQAAPECDPDPDDDDVIYCAWEDCGASTITISRPCAVSSLYPFNFDLITAEGSQATLDEDLLGLPSSASIPVGEYSLSLTFEVPQDNIDEGTETLYLKVVSGSIESEITVILFDTPAFESELPEEYIVPCDETEEICVDLIQDPFYEYPPVEYAWSVNGVSYGEDSCITYGALTSSLVEVYLEDGCEREDYHQSVFTVPYEPLEVSTSNDTLLCNGAEMLLTLEVDGGQPPYQIQWDDFSDEDYVHLIGPEENTNYEVVVVDNCDYSEEEVTQVRVQTVETTIIRENLGGDAYQFDVLTDPEEPFEGAYIYAWDFGDGEGSFLRRPVHTFDGVSTYETLVNVVTDIGCTDSDRIDVYGDVIFYIPTAFTPDNDGLNDVLTFNGRQVRLFEIWIFNRWGEQVYHSTDVNEVWTGDVNDGTHYAPNGVYHWLIKATGFDTDAQEFRGFVHLIR